MAAYKKDTDYRAMYILKSPLAALVTILLTHASATPLGQRSVPVIEADLSMVVNKVNMLDQLITSYPMTGGSLSGAFEIHSAAVSIMGALVTATKDVTANGALDMADSANIVQMIDPMMPVIQHAVSLIITKKASLTSSPVGGIAKLVAQDLENVDGNSTALANALSMNVAASSVKGVTDFHNAVHSALSAAISAYTT